MKNPVQWICVYGFKFKPMFFCANHKLWFQLQVVGLALKQTILGKQTFIVFFVVPELFKVWLWTYSDENCVYVVFKNVLVEFFSL